MKFALLLLTAGLIFTAQAQAKLEGQIKVDGSSTVFPITEAVAEEFGKSFPGIRVHVGTSGTGGGFKKFALGEIDINDASRTIKDSERDAAKAKGIGYAEVPVAYDGITVVVHKDNNWVDKLTMAELKKIWEPNSKVKTWKDIRATWPDRKILLYGPGTDSGTFDFFTEAVNGKAQVSRSEFTKSEDDNVLVQGVEGAKTLWDISGLPTITPTPLEFARCQLMMAKALLCLLKRQFAWAHTRHFQELSIFMSQIRLRSAPK